MALRGATRKPVSQRKSGPRPEAAVAPRKRMSVEDRERQILDGAVEFFSRHGLDGQMRVLAQGIGVTHALLYHYFPTKQALIDRVYQELFEGRWKPEWETLLDDPRLPIPEKLTRFYCDYAAFILSRDFVRIFVFSGLSDHYITDRFFDLLRERLFPRLVRETRKYRGLKSRAKPSPRELELLMGLHGGIFYTGIRRWIYGQEVHGAEGSEQDRIYIEDRVKAYLASAAIVLDSEAAVLPAAKRRTSPATRTAKGD